MYDLHDSREWNAYNVNGHEYVLMIMESVAK